MRYEIHTVGRRLCWELWNGDYRYFCQLPEDGLLDSQQPLTHLPYLEMSHIRRQRLIPQANLMLLPIAEDAGVMHTYYHQEPSSETFQIALYPWQAGTTCQVLAKINYATNEPLVTIRNWISPHDKKQLDVGHQNITVALPVWKHIERFLQSVTLGQQYTHTHFATLIEAAMRPRIIGERAGETIPLSTRLLQPRSIIPTDIH